MESFHFTDPYAMLHPERDTPHQVSAAMADALHNPRLMKPTLFQPFMQFMNSVLTSALRKYSPIHC